MLSLRQIRSRIRSIENISKITRAMEMVSAAKLSRMQGTLNGYRPYAQKIEQLFVDLLSGADRPDHPLFRKKRKAQTALCVVTSDSGLCSGYNQNVLKLVDKFAAAYQPGELQMVPMGKKGFNHCKKRGYQAEHTFLGAHGRYSPALTESFIKTLMELFLSGEVDEVHVAYTRFSAGMRNKPVVERILPLGRAAGEASRDVILEPGFGQIFASLAPQYISNKVKLMLLESFVAEHSARAVAMKTATDNAKELLEALVLQRNKMRQASITKEVLEIISAVEALKG